MKWSQNYSSFINYERMGEFIKVAKDLEVTEIRKKSVKLQTEEEDVTEQRKLKKKLIKIVN